MTNPYETLKRLEKATRLADEIQRAGISAEEVAAAGPSFWADAATVSETWPPSEKTRALVIQLLRSRSNAGQIAAAIVNEHLVAGGAR